MAWFTPDLRFSPQTFALRSFRGDEGRDFVGQPKPLAILMSGCKSVVKIPFKRSRTWDSYVNDRFDVRSSPQRPQSPFKAGGESNLHEFWIADAHHVDHGARRLFKTPVDLVDNEPALAADIFVKTIGPAWPLL